MKFSALAILLGLLPTEGVLIQKSAQIHSLNKCQLDDFGVGGHQSLVEKKGWKYDLPGDYEKSEVKEINADDFLNQNFEKGGKFILAYHPQCPHCVKLVKDYKDFAHAAKEKGVDVQAMNMSSKKNANKENSEKFCPDGFPTVKFFKNSKDSVELDGKIEANT